MTDINDAQSYRSLPEGLEGSAGVFERAQRLAKSLFGAVTARVALVDDGEVWRSGEETRGEICAVHRALAADGLLWVEDGPLDPRFCNEALVVGPPHVRFYASAPIRVADGVICGALWVASREPRAFDADLAARLQDIADFVADEWSRIQSKRAGEIARKEGDASRRTLASIIEAAPIRLVITDRDLTVIAASPLWARGRLPEGQSVIGCNLYDLLPHLKSLRGPAYARCLQGETIRDDRVASQRPDGSPLWLEVVLMPWREHDGTIGGLISTSHDITNVVQALERSERSEERLNLAMDIADVHVWEIDYRRRELVRCGAEDTFFSGPMTYEDVENGTWSNIDPRDREATRAAWRRHVKDGAPYRPEYRLARTDGKEVWAACAVRSITDGNGAPLRLIGAMQNVTDRKLAEQALVEAKEQAEAATRAKSAFLATMSHEIRTPLNGVLGMAQAMGMGELTTEQRGRLDVIRQSGETLLAILNDVLDLSKIEAGKMELEQAEFDIIELARGAHATFAATAQAKGLDFDLRVTKAAQGVYRGDSVRLRQVLYNLVSNALKFTEVGKVKVTVSRRGGVVSLTVADDGIGIAPDRLSKLFEKFEQADVSTTRRFGGTGLGLAICRDLVALMGGTIQAHSPPSGGATFVVKIPLPRVADAPAGPADPRIETISPVEGAPLRVLAAEDNSVNRLVLKTLLNQVGVEPVIVCDGQEAVEAWAGDDWDLILMDVQMPRMDGLTAAGLIRTRERAESRRRTPIVALTANAMAHQVTEYLQCGMDDIVAKPIEAGRLYAVIQAVLDAGPPVSVAA